MSGEYLAALALELCASAALFSEAVRNTLYHGHALDVGRLQAALARVGGALAAAEEGVDGLVEGPSPLPTNCGWVDQR